MPKHREWHYTFEVLGLTELKTKKSGQKEKPTEEYLIDIVSRKISWKMNTVI
jgi:hypothetical protein